MTLKLNKKIIGVDLGGTKVAAGLVDGTQIVKKNYGLIPNSSKNAQDVIDKIIEVIDSIFDTSVEGIGIGIPSLVHREKGIVYSPQNIPCWKEVHLKDILEEKFKVPVFLDNDANCFALGESKFGVGKEDKNFVGVCLGTGMGSGIIYNGSLLKDANCGSGEFGSIPYQNGILEDYCSGKFFMKNYGVNGQVMLDKAKNGDEDALEAFRKFGQHLGNGIKIIMFSVDPKAIIIGGSVANSKEFFYDEMIKVVRSFPYGESAANLVIKFTNTSDIPILGAASLYYDRTL